MPFWHIHEKSHSLAYWIFGELNVWLDMVLHIVLVVGPVALFVVTSVWIIRPLLEKWHERASSRQYSKNLPTVPGFGRTLFAHVLRYTRHNQLALVALSILAMPVLYASLELPKLIINNAINSSDFPTSIVGRDFSQTEYLFALSALYFFAVLLNGILKYCINVYKGCVGERMLRRLRLSVYRRWRADRDRGDRAEVVPLLVQEVERVGSFSADILVQPIFQAGTFLTILVFMFVQDPILGAAAVTLLPVQLGLVPPLQQQVNRLARERVQEVRKFGGLIGEEIKGGAAPLHLLKEIGSSLRCIQGIRINLYKKKYMMKAVLNFINSMTPFFFYTVGGYLVINGSLSFGALVAVLAAYKDFSAPLRELFLYYQMLEDVRIRYCEILRYLAGSDAVSDERPEPSMEGAADDQPTAWPVTPATAFSVNARA